MSGEEKDDAGEQLNSTTGTTTTTKFKPIGPPTVGMDSKKKYKFVEPPGISTWVISFAKKCLVCGLIYTLGYFQVSIGWLVSPIILLVVRDQWRRHHDAQRALAAASAKGDEREIVLARLGENLPSWVVFPDVERAEWLNLILRQLWPRINHYTYDLVHSSIEPGLRDTLATNYKMGSFRFEKIILGDTPLRIRGVKVYDEKKTDRNEIIMDLDVIYAGDCDFRFSVAKMRAGIKDLQLSGTLRLVMKPLVNQMPLIGGIQYFFLNPPSLDFNLIGIADVFDMPGLSDLIRRIVQEQISSMCVLPNKMFIQLAEDVNASDVCAMKPQGVIRICAIEAKNLMKKDVGVLGMGKSDPYVILSVGAQSFKSKTINNTVNPKWEFYCEMIVEDLEQHLNVVLYDFDEIPRQDEFLGRTSVDISMVAREGVMDVWLELEDVKKGQIHLKMEWLGFSSNPADLKTAIVDSMQTGMAAALLTVRLDSAKNLPVLQKKPSGGLGFKNSKIMKEGSKPDPYAILSVGKSQKESQTMEKTTDPVFEETFHFLVRNPLTDTLLIKCMDKKTSLELGGIKQSLDLVYHRPEMKMEKQMFALHTRSEAKLVLNMEFKVLKKGAFGTFGYDSEAEEKEVEEPEGKDTAGGSTDPSSKPPIEKKMSAEAPKAEEKSELVRSGSIRSNVSDISRSSIIRPELSESETIRAEDRQPLLSSAPGAVTDMKIRLTIRYSQTSQQLVVVVHSLANLPIEKEELPDPYVKLYVLPERNKKQKTEAQKDQCNPVYDERFDFPVIDLRGKILQATVCDKKFIRSSPKMGEVLIPLDDFQLGNTVTTWYPLTT